MASIIAGARALAPVAASQAGAAGSEHTTFRRGMIFCTALAIAANMTLFFSAPAMAADAKAKKAAAATQVVVLPKKPLGDAKAPTGGTLYYNVSKEPPTINPITSTDLPAFWIHQFLVDTLLSRDPETYEWNPGLAETAEISADGMTFTFHLRKGALWSDGKPITAEDVKFSYDAIFDDAFSAAHKRPYFENIGSCELVDPYTIRFTAKTKYFDSLSALAETLFIVPKHVYGDAKEGAKKNKTVVLSGPYVVEKYDQGQRITLSRNKNWWGNSVEYYKGYYKFDKVVFRFVSEETVELEMLKKGEIDFQQELTPEVFEKKAVGPEWGTKVLKIKAENKAPKMYGYVGWNLRRDIFKDKDVRIALQMLMNRDEMNRKFRYNMSLPATGPWYQQSEYADPSVKAIPFDPKKAAAILAKAGWKDTDGDGVLDKVIDGKKTNFAFTLSHGNKDFEKYLTLYQDDLRKAGVKMDIKLLEWNALLKMMDDGTFDAVTLRWGGGSVDIDPKQIWHSSSAVKGGSNFINYQNKEVDKLIDAAREEFDKGKRTKLLRKVYGMIAADAPYAFFFNDKYVLYPRSARLGTTKDSFNYDISFPTWWVKP